MHSSIESKTPSDYQLSKLRDHGQMTLQRLCSQISSPFDFGPNIKFSSLGLYNLVLNGISFRNFSKLIHYKILICLEESIRSVITFSRLMMRGSQQCPLHALWLCKEAMNPAVVQSNLLSFWISIMGKRKIRLELKNSWISVRMDPLLHEGTFSIVLIQDYMKTILHVDHVGPFFPSHSILYLNFQEHRFWHMPV